MERYVGLGGTEHCHAMNEAQAHFTRNFICLKYFCNFCYALSSKNCLFFYFNFKSQVILIRNISIVARNYIAASASSKNISCHADPMDSFSVTDLGSPYICRFSMLGRQPEERKSTQDSPLHCLIPLYSGQDSRIAPPWQEYRWRRSQLIG